MWCGGTKRPIKSEIENFDLSIFSKQAHYEECSQQVWWSFDKNSIFLNFGQKFNFLKILDKISIFKKILKLMWSDRKSRFSLIEKITLKVLKYEILSNKFCIPVFFAVTLFSSVHENNILDPEFRELREGSRKR